MTRVAIVGLGSRGLDVFGTHCRRHQDSLEVAVLVDPDPKRREMAQGLFGEARVFSSWEAWMAEGVEVDASIIATPDEHHVAPALACLERGQAVLLEKPMALDEEGCRRLVEAARGRILAVCHVLRYTDYFKKLRALTSHLGQIWSVRHFEPVNFWHYAHSFVRGNWRRRDHGSPFILAKCCHDTDILLFLLGKRCRRLVSFGSLSHFRPESAPADAARRCLDCSLVESCVYSAPRFYGKFLEENNHGWPLNVLTTDFTPGGLEQALAEGPYGRCVYHCDNDVVDHQVVSMEFDGGLTANFTAAAFTDHRARETEILGSLGSLKGNGRQIEWSDFASRRVETLEIEGGSGHHLGGDEAMFEEFFEAVRSGDPSRLSSGPEVSLESHLMAFAAEKSRLEGRIITLD